MGRTRCRRRRTGRCGTSWERPKNSSGLEHAELISWYTITHYPSISHDVFSRQSILLTPDIRLSVYATQVPTSRSTHAPRASMSPGTSASRIFFSASPPVKSGSLSGDELFHHQDLQDRALTPRPRIVSSPKQ